MHHGSARLAPDVTVPTGSRSWLATALLAAVFLALYASTLNRWQSGDDLQFILHVERTVEPLVPHPASPEWVSVPGPLPAAEAFELRYFLEWPVSGLVFRTARALGWNGRALWPVTVFHAMVSALALACFFRGLNRITNEPRLAAVVTAGLGCSYAWWYYSTHVDYTILSHAISCILLMLLAHLFARRADRENRLALLLGATVATIGLCLITSFMLTPVIAGSLWLYARERGMPVTRRLLLRYAAGFALAVVAVAALFIVVQPAGIPSLSGLIDQIKYSGSPAHAFAISDIPKGVYGITKAFTRFPGLAQSEASQLLADADRSLWWAYMAWSGAVLAVILAPFATLPLVWRSLGQWTGFTLTLLAWFAGQYAFTTYWEPTYIKWMPGLLIVWWALVGLELSILSARGHRLARPARIGTVALAMVLFVANLTGKFLPSSRPSSDTWTPVTETLSASSRDEDVFVSLTPQYLDLHLPYFGRRQVLSYAFALQTTNDTARAHAALLDGISRTARRNGRVFLIDCTDAQLEAFGRLLRQRRPATVVTIAHRLGFGDGAVPVCELTSDALAGF
jgi:hypothetical protein